MKRLINVVVYFTLLIGVAIAVELFHKNRLNQTDKIAKAFRDNIEFKHDNLSDLPLLKFEAKKDRKNYFVIIIPGDGGWRDVVDFVSKKLALSGINVVGLNTIPYLSDYKSPQQIAKDLERIIRNFSSVWKIDSVILGGYSFGAEILPFAYNQLDSVVKSKVVKIMMIAPSNLADFKVSPIYFYSSSKSKPVIPEMQKIDPGMFIIYCEHYRETICKSLPAHSHYEVIRINSRHLFTGHYKEVSEAITKRLLKI
jgi:type IV secretory pathway VirJ component